MSQTGMPLKLNCPCCKKPRNVAGGTPLMEQEDELRQQNADPWRLREGWSLEAAASGRLQWACHRCLKDGQAIRGCPAVQTFSDYEPYFAYFDVELRCEDCEQKFVFTGREQQFWYEQLKFWVQSRPKQCVSCRRARRQRASEQRSQQPTE